MPPEVAQQYQDVVQRSQWQRAQLEQGGAAFRRGRVRNGSGKEGVSGEGGTVDGCVWRGRVKKGLKRGLSGKRCVQGAGNGESPWYGRKTEVGEAAA